MHITEATVDQLITDGRMPSGVAFEMVPDEVDNLVRIGEIAEKDLAMKVLRERHVILASVGGTPLPKNRDGLRYVMGLPECDIVFLGLAWNIQCNGSTIKLPNPVECPSCGAPSHSIDIGSIPCSVVEPGGDAFEYVRVEDADMTAPGLEGAEGVYVRAPTLQAARTGLTTLAQWSNEDLVVQARARGAVFKKTETGFAPVSHQHTGKWRTRQLSRIIEACDKLPSVGRIIRFHCEECKETVDVPFDGPTGR